MQICLSATYLKKLLRLYQLNTNRTAIHFFFKENFHLIDEKRGLSEEDLDV